MLLWLFFLLALAKPEQALSLTVVPQKATFRQGEPVVVSLVMENRGRISLFIDRRFLPGPEAGFGREITLWVTGPRSRPLPFLSLIQPSRLTQASIQKLSPGRSVAKTLVLTQYFAIHETGRYLLQGMYDTTSIESPLRFWKGKIVSPVVVFSVE